MNNMQPKPETRLALIAAYNYVASGYCVKFDAMDIDGNEVSALSHRAVAFSVIGAVCRANPEYNIQEYALQYIQDASCDLFGKSLDADLMTFGQALACFSKAIDNIDAEIAA